MNKRERNFWAKTRASDKIYNGTNCIEWIGYIKPEGYGTFWNGKTVYAHRFAYELVYGAIPEGLHLDHLCRNRWCVNATHLEAVTNRANILRGTAPSAINAVKERCKFGHLFTEENTYRTKAGSRQCRICKRDKMREARAK